MTSGLNKNQGAESTLAYLWTAILRLQLEQQPTPKAYSWPPAAGRAKAARFHTPSLESQRGLGDFNQSMLPVKMIHPVLRGRQSHEPEYIRELITEQAQRSASFPLQVELPVGYDTLQQLIGSDAMECSP